MDVAYQRAHWDFYSNVYQTAGWNDSLDWDSVTHDPLEEYAINFVNYFAFLLQSNRIGWNEIEDNTNNRTEWNRIE